MKTKFVPSVGLSPIVRFVNVDIIYSIIILYVQGNSGKLPECVYLSDQYSIFYIFYLQFMCTFNLCASTQLGGTSHSLLLKYISICITLHFLF